MSLPLFYPDMNNMSSTVNNINTIVNGVGNVINTAVIPTVQTIVHNVETLKTSIQNAEIKKAAQHGIGSDYFWSVDEVSAEIERNYTTQGIKSMFCYSVDNKQPCDITAEVLADLAKKGFVIRKATTEEVVEWANNDPDNELNKKIVKSCFGGISVNNILPDLCITFNGVNASLI